MRLLLACVLASVSVTTAGVIATGRGDPPHAQTTGDAARGRSLSTRQALDLYLQGDVEGALNGPPALTRFVAADAERWVSAGGAAAAEGRALAAATFALEYAGGRPALLPALLTWARELLARQPPRAAEADWLRASMALAEGLERWVFLLEGVPQAARGGKAPPPPVGHIRFARQRYPDDPYFQMADGIGAELSASRSIGYLSAPPPQTASVWDRITADLADAAGAVPPNRAASLERAAGLFERLVTHQTLGAEAHLRLGYVRLRQHRPDDALAHLDQVAATTEQPAFRYLGHLYSGWVLASLGRVDEAAIAYRAALSFVPRAQSATALYVALLAQNDRLRDAEGAAETFLSAGAVPSDPWRRYFGGDFDAYPDLVRRLREQFR